MVVIAKTSNPFSELAIPTKVSTNEVKPVTETWQKTSGDGRN